MGKREVVTIKKIRVSDRRMKKKLVLLCGFVLVFFIACTWKDKTGEDWIQHVISTGVFDDSVNKSQNISQPMQIYQGKMYMIGLDEVEKTDLKTGEKTNLTRKLGDKFYIQNDRMYFADYRKEDCVSVCSLSNIAYDMSEVFWNNISDFLIVDEEMIGLRTDGKKSTLLRYDGHKEELLFEFPDEIEGSYVEDFTLAGYYDGKYYLVDHNEAKIYQISEEGKNIQKIFSINEKLSFTYSILEVRYMEGHLYVLGTVIDTEQSSIGGLFYVKDAEDTGVWDISLDSKERTKISPTLFDDLYVYNKNVYGINDVNGIKYMIQLK